MKESIHCIHYTVFLLAQATEAHSMSYEEILIELN